MPKLGIKEAASTLEMKILDFIEQVQRDSIPHVEEEGWVYFDEDRLMPYFEEIVENGAAQDKTSAQPPAPAETETAPSEITPITPQTPSTTQLSRPTKRGIPAITPPPQPQPPTKTPAPPPSLPSSIWKEQASKVLGSDLSLYLTNYGEEKVEKVVVSATSYLQEDKARLIFQADENDEIFKLQNGDLYKYWAKLYEVLEKVEERYGETMPLHKIIEMSPSGFMPSKIEQTANTYLLPQGEGNANDEENQNGQGNADENEQLYQKMGISEELHDRLLEQGHNPSYLHAIMIKGFQLGTSNERFNEHYKDKDDFYKNIETTLRSLKVNPNKKDLRKEMDLLQSIIEDRKHGECITLSSKWADIAEGALREYIMTKKRPDRNGKRHGTGSFAAVDDDSPYEIPKIDETTVE